MNDLRKKMQSLDKTNPEERVIYQVMDLQLIKHKGKEKGILPEDIELIINGLIEDWIWLYENEFSMLSNPKEVMNARQIVRFGNMTTQFGNLQDFMRMNMDLTE